MSTTLTGQPDTGSAAAAAAAAASAAAGSQGASDWRATLPEALRGDPTLGQIKGKDWAEAGPTLAQQLVHAQKLIGADKIVVPGPNATPQERRDFYTKLGTPAKFEEYELKLPTGVTEGQIDKTRLDAWRKALWEEGVPKGAAEKLITAYLAEQSGLAAGQVKLKTDQMTLWETQTKEKFGEKFDETVNRARFALQKMGSPELIAALDESGFGSNPSVIEFFSKVGAALGDGNARSSGGGDTSNFTAMSPAAAQAALDQFNRDPIKMKALFNAGTTVQEKEAHEAVVRERGELFKRAYPDDGGASNSR